VRLGKTASRPCATRRSGRAFLTPWRRRYFISVALGLEQAGHAAERIETQAVVTLDKEGDGFSITTVDLTCRAHVPGMDAATFDKVAQATKQGCPVSKVLKAKINLDARLES